MDKKTLATQLKNNPLLWDTFKESEGDIYETWRSETDKEARERLWCLQRALEELRERLDDRINQHANS